VARSSSSGRPSGWSGGVATRQASRSGDPRLSGTAQPRPAYQRPYQGGTTIYYAYPYFGVGLYNPYYGGSSFGWNRWGYGYGYWNDPFLYDPFGYYSVYPYYWGNLSDRESWGSDERDERQASGSLRLRVSPREARVYVDGALAGIVDEFDGLTNHLRLPAGPHQIEFRADGYESLKMDVTVPDGKTRTERASLKRR